MFKHNRFGRVRKKRQGPGDIILPLVLFAAIILLFNMGINQLTQVNEEEALGAMHTAITRAAVQFYALEGRYPPTLSYLVEQFGLQLDEERYTILYRAFASNIMPQVIVLPREAPR